MDLDREIGQHFVCGFPGTEMDEGFRGAVRRYKIANIILFAHNIESKGQAAKLCADIQELVLESCGTPALICVDQEGGMVTRLSEDCANVPGAMALAATGDPWTVREAGRITAEELSALGFTCDLAPSLDVNSNSGNPVIGVRSYGDRPETVIAYGLEMIKALQENGIMSVAKHFPGHGNTRVDSHLDLPRIEASREELEIHLAPFRAAVQAGVQGVMSSHILFPAYESEHLPATMSRAILTGLLKDEIGFGGLVFTDCMEMKAIQNHFGTVKASLKALQAGVDLVCVSHHVDLACEAMDLVREALESGCLDRKEFSRSTEKILAAKRGIEPRGSSDISSVGGAEHRAASRSLRERTICLVRGPLPALGENPFFAGPRCFRATNASNAEHSVVFAPAMAARFGGKFYVTSENPGSDEIGEAVSLSVGSTSAVVGTYNGHLQRGQLELVNALAAQDIPVICVALRNPYDLPLVSRKAAAIAAFEYTRSSLEVLEAVLSGKLKPAGILPVQIGD